MGGNEQGMDQKAAGPEPDGKKGSAAPCGGALHRRFEQAKNNPRLQGAIAILVDTVMNGTPEEKGPAKSALHENLLRAGDYCKAVREAFETSNGDPVVKGAMTAHFSAMLKTEDGLRRMNALAAIGDEGVLKEVIKAAADTRDPAALDFIILASRSCSHPVGAWQAPKVADAGNIDRVKRFIEDEASGQSPALRERILDSARREFDGRGLAPAAQGTKPSPASGSFGRFEPKVEIAHEQAFGASSRDFPPGLPLSQMSLPQPAVPAGMLAKGGSDMSMHVRNVEAFYKIHGMVSPTRRKAKACQLASPGETPADSRRFTEEERRDAAPGAMPGIKAAPGESPFPAASQAGSAENSRRKCPAWRGLPSGKAQFPDGASTGAPNDSGAPLPGGSGAGHKYPAWRGLPSGKALFFNEADWGAGNGFGARLPAARRRKDTEWRRKAGQRPRKPEAREGAGNRPEPEGTRSARKVAAGETGLKAVRRKPGTYKPQRHRSRKKPLEADGKRKSKPKTKGRPAPPVSQARASASSAKMAVSRAKPAIARGAKKSGRLARPGAHAAGRRAKPEARAGPEAGASRHKAPGRLPKNAPGAGWKRKAEEPRGGRRSESGKRRKAPAREAALRKRKKVILILLMENRKRKSKTKR